MCPHVGREQNTLIINTMDFNSCTRVKSIPSDVVNRITSRKLNEVLLLLMIRDYLHVWTQSLIICLCHFPPMYGQGTSISINMYALKCALPCHV